MQLHKSIIAVFHNSSPRFAAGNPGLRLQLGFYGSVERLLTEYVAAAGPRGLM